MSYHFTHLLQVLYNFFHDLIHVLYHRGRGIQPPGDKNLMSTETSCHFDYLLLVSNHRQQQFLKNPLFYLFLIQKHKGPNLTLPLNTRSRSTQGHHLRNLEVLEHPMMHIKILGHQPFGSREEFFFLSFYYIWAWRAPLSCHQDHLSKLLFPHPIEAPYEI